ncbi:hydrogenase [Desulfosporosinus sp. HMP52]|uniref:4Fe-4S dicluster domain-containing protein n=1 Tax=Desulfosporosinus sp. HMP52 TaxID=1487923 RepID=UPI00051FE496|nr:4Fe-4S dicluster domain-containing protein [Desulfosporosinus sp. HMP52]KGK81245.1 hydrogenase [Desulfosporosinus sp. HMP52]
MQKIYYRANHCDGCQACEVACIEKKSFTKSLFMAKLEQPTPKARINFEKFDNKYWASICQHCIEAMCVGACMTGAMHYSETGEVVHNLEQCVGCGMCIMVCPFGAVVMLEDAKKVSKCDLCEDEKIPPCVIACTRRALCYCTPEDYENEGWGDGLAISHHW